MKLLIENFRRFINEQETMFFGGEGMSEGGYSEEEAAYFKDLPQIAEQISNAFDKFFAELESQYKRSLTIVDIQKNIMKFVRYVDDMTGGKAKYVGHGKFRCVFDCVKISFLTGAWFAPGSQGWGSGGSAGMP